MSRPMPTSPSQPGLIDPLVDSLLDFSEYDNVYQSPSLSPTTTNKSSFSRPAVKQESSTVASLIPTPQTMSGPSHQYDLYKQQTGLVPGALASTLAVNQNNTQLQGYNNGFGIDYLGIGTTTDDLFDFNTQPSQPSLQSAGGGEMDMDFDSPASAVASSQQGFFFGDASTVNPNSIGGQEPSSMSPASSVGRVWPGMHAQAALAKAQAQQRQQQQMIQQQRQQQQNRQTSQQQSQQPQQQRKSVQATDPIVEQKISQLLNSMRTSSGMDDGSGHAPMHNIPRPRKDEDDMDDDERLLASEEGKKLSSKERRQLRNKVSARAFRSRRKEYITQLEAEIANKVTENGDLRAENRALVEENKRLTDLTRMLLSSPSFSNFLDRLSTNPQQLPQQQQRAQSIAQPQQTQQQQQQDARQPPKDVNVYAARQQMQHQQIGMAMIPEQTMDFSMLSLDAAAATPTDAFNFQPQVYAVLDIETSTPNVVIDPSVLSGKTSNFVGEQTFESEDAKVEMPSLPELVRPVVEEEKQEREEKVTLVIDEEFEKDPAFALYHDAPATSKTEVTSQDPELQEVDIWGGIEAEKALARYELVDAAESDETAAAAMAKVQRISAGLETVLARLELLTIDL